MTDPVSLLTVKQAAAKLGVKPPTVYAWIRQGRMRTVRSEPLMIMPIDCLVPPRAERGPDVLGRPAVSGARFRGKG